MPSMIQDYRGKTPAACAHAQAWLDEAMAWARERITSGRRT